MTQLDDLYVPLLVSAGENGKLQEVYDLEKFMASKDTWPEKSGDFRNMYTHIHRV